MTALVLPSLADYLQKKHAWLTSSKMHGYIHL